MNQVLAEDITNPRVVWREELERERELCIARYPLGPLDREEAEMLEMIEGDLPPDHDTPEYRRYCEESYYEGPHRGDMYVIDGRIFVYRHRTTINAVQDPTDAWVLRDLLSGEDKLAVPFYEEREPNLLECPHSLDQLDRRGEYDF
jgi:hypothetical protein